MRAASDITWVEELDPFGFPLLTTNYRGYQIEIDNNIGTWTIWAPDWSVLGGGESPDEDAAKADTLAYVDRHGS